jgi:hypothetical protein
MAIVINGSGTVTGISVGGLPDGIVDAGTLATNSVDSAELVDGAVDDSHMAAMAASKLTGALPAISGASLTSLPVSSVLISTTNASDGDSYITMLNIFDGTYDKYVMECFNFLPNTDNSALRAHFQAGGVINTTSTYDSNAIAGSGGSISAWINATNAANFSVAGHGNQGSGSNEQCYFSLEILEPYTTRETFWKGTSTEYAANGNHATVITAGCFRTSTPVTGIRFHYHQGTFKSGKVKLYGVK